MYKSQQIHKAKHGGYKSKPSAKSVNALLNMYAEVHKAVTPKPKVKEGTQLTLF